jgi:hypothetical protein
MEKPLARVASGFRWASAPAILSSVATRFPCCSRIAAASSLRQQFDAPPVFFGPWHGSAQTQGRAIQPFPMLAQVAGQGGIKLRSQQGQSIPCLAQSRCRMDQAQGEVIQPLLVAGDAIPGGPAQRRSKIGNFGGGFVPSLSGKFGGGSRRRRTQVGDQVDDGGIGLVSDAADDGQAAGGDGPCDDFLVESPQVFDAAPAAYHKQQVAFIAPTCRGDCRGNFCCGGLTLHQRRVKNKLQVPRAALQGHQYIAQGGGTGRTDDPDPARKAG